MDGRSVNSCINNWTAGKLCQSRVEFCRVDETNGADMNELIVLDEFEHLVTVEGVSVASLGVVVTSRALFRDVERAVHDQGDSLVLSTDGTYRIHFGGWTLVDCGGISVERSGTGYVQRFRPWIYMCVKTESIIAYEHMLRALVKYAKTFLNLELKVHSASIDHADAIASAFELVWPHIEILSCWEHFLRQSRKQTKLEKTKGFMKDIGKQHLRLLHQSRSLKQFRALSKRVVKAWKESGEDKLAEWLQNVYLTKRWERWSVNSSSVPGFLPSQQPIESHHRVIKVIVTDYKKAPTITVLNSVLPRVLLYDATNLTPEHHRHYAEGLKFIYYYYEHQSI
ncbi:40S ribosomal protein S7 [Phytophthora nicotianae]|uniref:40S ribosomal protein S7 n=1 Tax=Phytophthora nicotianae TaxID=4792 RepID=A0A0W8D9B1_PHYNI|nr:40S ribosomal protein S7 [Phytophthora nicotianae]